MRRYREEPPVVKFCKSTIPMLTHSHVSSNYMIHPVIMAGGTGSRLWPLSRQLNPKQFLKLTDDRLSRLQLTVARLDGRESADPVLFCNEEHRFLAAGQM